MAVRVKEAGETAARLLRYRILFLLLLVSLIPLTVVSVGSWRVFGGLLEEQAIKRHTALVQSRSIAIETWLDSQVRILTLAAETHSFPAITDPLRFRELFHSVSKVSGGAFIDLGVIDRDGGHRVYEGPFDLLDRNYRETEWFRQVISDGLYISDVFTGYRQVPHIIIAVKMGSISNPWILRATLNGQQFDEMVASARIGLTGDAFVVNREGAYQSSARTETLASWITAEMPDYFSGVKSRTIRGADGKEYVRVQSWMLGGRWLLVVTQAASEIRAPLNRAITLGALLVLVSVILLVGTTIYATWSLTARIEQVTREREEMTAAFMRSARLASIGELSTGLAHEINNPLAILSVEQTNLSDVLQETSLSDAARSELLEILERCRHQVQRCAGITRKMLQFGRKQASVLQRVSIEEHLAEIARFLERQANIRNVQIELDVQDDLPEVKLDPDELEQVMTNLVTNSIQAMTQGGRVILRAKAAAEEVRIEVEDTGPGIPDEVLERVFEPFFTTKPPGEGTGLGLSVCYGIVQSWGGRLTLSSERGRGTTASIHLAQHVQPSA